MIVFGGPKLVPSLQLDAEMSEQKWWVYNFMCLVNIGRYVNDLFPPKQMLEFFRNSDMGSPEFDKYYTEYILNEDNAFVAFMDIMMGQYYGGNAFVLYDDNSPLIDNLVDSISKLIEFRYGLVPRIVHEEIDLFYLGNDDAMSPQGIEFFMADKERYTQLVTDPKELMGSSMIMEDISGGTI